MERKTKKLSLGNRCGSKLLNVYALLDGLRTGVRIDNCGQECHQDMVRREVEESAKLEMHFAAG